MAHRNRTMLLMKRGVAIAWWREAWEAMLPWAVGFGEGERLTYYVERNHMLWRSMMAV